MERASERGGGLMTKLKEREVCLVDEAVRLWNEQVREEAGL